MKYLSIGLLFIWAQLIFSIDLIDSSNIISFDRQDLLRYDQITINTHRSKDGEELYDKWVGVLLKDILNEYEITDFDKLCFTSIDNYLVRVSKDNIINNNCILAIKRNDKMLSDDHIRLVIPNLRDMFWIQDINTIKTESISDVPFPHTIYFASTIIQDTPLRKELPPFINVEGYTFTEIMDKAFPFLKDEILLIGKDGIKHSLDYEKYLKNAILVKNEHSFDLKSPDMPAGMWIKDIAYIQIFDVALIFNTRFESLGEVNELVNWNILPDEVLLSSSKDNKKVSSKLSFNNEQWKEVKWLKW